MKSKDHPSQNATPLFVEDRDVLGQIKPSGINVIKRHKHKSKNAPDLKVTYAGLGARAIAAFIDLAIVLIMLLIMELFFFKFNYANNEFNIYRFFIFIFTWFFYNESFESSVYQATFGEMILKLKVVDLRGKRMSIIRSSFRCIVTIISILPIGIGIWYITTDPKKRTWHDMIAGTYVIKT
jgi:uncharacterized RDD family membrane protein YckC